MIEIETKSVINRKNVIFSIHIPFGSTGNDFYAIKEYFIRNKAGKLLWISHPFKYHPQSEGSGFEIYEQGQLVKKQFSAITHISDSPSQKPYSFLHYLKDSYLTIWYVIKSKELYDCYIGYGVLHSVCGWMVKKMGKTKYCIYLSGDFTPKLFNNKLLNKTYHALDTFCVKHCDETWNMSVKMIEARKEHKNFDPSTYSKQKVVPGGIWLDEVKPVKFEQVHKKRIVYMGSLIKQQGVQYVLHAIPLIVEKIPDFKFLVIGSGKYLPELQRLVKGLAIEQYVEFTGRVEEHNEMTSLIASSALAVAPYEKGDHEGNWMYSSDSGKIKNYMGCGTPVLVSSVPYNAAEIEQEKCGKVIDLQPAYIAEAVLKFLLDEEKLKRYRENVVRYTRQFDNNKIYSQALNDC